MAVRRIFGAALVAVVLGVLVTVVGRGRGGALVSPDKHSSYRMSITRPVGTTVSFGGGLMLVNSTHETVTVTDVVLEHVDPGLRYEGWRVDHPVRRGRGVDSFTELVGTDVGFPPPGHPITDRRVAPSRTRDKDGRLIGDAAVVIGITLLAPGHHEANGLRVRYRDRTGSHSIRFAVSVAMCTDSATCS